MATKSYSTDQQVQRHRWWILAAVGLFTFMSTLDASIVNIALPVVSGDLKIPMNQAEWVVSIYLIVICSLLLLFGKLGDSVGKIKIFRIGTVLFVFGSLLAGFNGSFYLLLSARVVQALGASMTMANNNGIITEIFPFSERGRALGDWVVRGAGIHCRARIGRYRAVPPSLGVYFLVERADWCRDDHYRSSNPPQRHYEISRKD